MKKSAVEFMVKEISEILGPLKTEGMTYLLLLDAYNQAKAMEKEQIIRAHLMARCYDNPNSHNEAEQYYNETFKS